MQGRDVLPLRNFVGESHSSILLHAYNSGSKKAQLQVGTVEEKVPGVQLEASTVEEKVRGTES